MHAGSGLSKVEGHKVIPLRASWEQVSIWDNIEIGIVGNITVSKYEQTEFFVISSEIIFLLIL